MENLENQREEISVLKSIYSEDSIEVEELNGGKFDVISGKIMAHIRGSDYTVCVVQKMEDGSKRELSASVDHLPPIILHFVLPEDYPAQNPPRFILSCSWLGRIELSQLCRDLDQIWKENSGFPILFLWVNHLAEEALENLGIASPIDLSWIPIAQRRVKQNNRRRGSEREANANLSVPTFDSALKQLKEPSLVEVKKPSDRSVRKSLDPRAVNTLRVNDDILVILTAHDATEKVSVFRSEYHTCKVCFAEKQGVVCLQFAGCAHVYCNECMKSYFEVKVKDGEVKSLTCPEDKCDSQATPMQIRELLDPVAYDRYDSLLLSSSLATADTLFCPRLHCQYPVLVEKDSTLASCPSCLYNFCIFCKMTYHGVEPCKYKDEEKRKLIQQYHEASHEERIQMEKRYGKRQLQNLTDNILAEDWIEDNSKTCPHCRAKIEKSDGCNKMICWKCNTPFCWICGHKLNPQNPYLHFTAHGSKCFNRLFQGMTPEEIGDDLADVGGNSSDED